eukprot:934160-Amphidinium_carterae.4
MKTSISEPTQQKHCQYLENSRAGACRRSALGSHRTQLPVATPPEIPKNKVACYPKNYLIRPTLERQSPMALVFSPH